MGNFVIPTFQYIINNEEQAVLFGSNDGDDAVPYVPGLLSPLDIDDKFNIEGELGWIDTTALQLISPGVRVVKQIPEPTAYSIIEYGITKVTDLPLDFVFKTSSREFASSQIVYESEPLVKNYQIAIPGATAADIALQIVDTINADKNALVVAEIGAAPENVLLRSVSIGVVSKLVADEDYLTLAIISNLIGSIGKGNYKNLKNVQWANCTDFDRDAEYLPKQGASYTAYFFHLLSENAAHGGHVTPTNVGEKLITEYVFYINNVDAANFNGAFSSLATDMNI